MRAAIRANVLLVRLGEPNTDEATIRLAGRSYFALGSGLN
jgi:hypothetical protein